MPKANLIYCPTCCESKLSQEGDLFRCAVCGALFTTEQKQEVEELIDLAKSRGEEADLGKLRYLLRNELSAEYPETVRILDCIRDIRSILPDDPIATILESFYRRKSRRKEYHALLDSFKGALTPYEKKFLYPYIVDQCELIDATPVKAFLVTQGDASRLTEVDEALKQREMEADLFADVPRDVFICHAHADMERIQPLLDRLEQDEGYSLWYSERNLPKDTENYKSNIEAAIESCKVFLVFASAYSMASKDVQWELKVAGKKPMARRLEYRLEDRPNNIAFKHFFDGVQWIDGAFHEDYDLLAERIYSALETEDAPEEARRQAELEEARRKAEEEKKALEEALRKAEEEKKRLEEEKKQPVQPQQEIPGQKPILSSSGKTVIYGIYPQSVISDPALIAELNKIPAPEKNGWYLYKGTYYAKLTANPYNSNYSFSDGSPISKGTAYWFRCEPIEWRILDDGNSCFVISKALLDSQRYDDSSNNYASSEIRSWLNGEFLSSAFSLGDSSVLTTTVDNSVASTGYPSNQYACVDTDDKVFLLSNAEATNPDYGFSSDAARVAKPTDYALARGAYQYNEVGYWWLRSPGAYDFGYARRVGYDGSVGSRSVRGADRCVRPALRIKK